MTTQIPVPPHARRRQYLLSLAVGLFLFFLMAFDQGHVLSIIQGKVAYAQNVIHETVHDSRHANGMPCH